MSEIERAKEYPALKEKHMTRNDIIKGNIDMLDSGAIECRKIGKFASAEEKEIIAEILRAELERQANEPLTWDELKAMEGKAVYIKMLVDSPRYPSCWSIIGESYNYGDSEHVVILDAYASESGCLEKYGKSWLAYRYEPKGEKA